jgi:para-nitrobenzyl esterase
MYALLAPDAPAQADRVLAGYFGHETAARLLAGYADAFPDLGNDALRTTVMTDERYVVRTERLADAQAAHAPVWRSRYDGPYTGLDRDPDPAFAQYAPLLTGAHGGDGVGIWQGGDGLSAALHAAWGAFATTGDSGWAPYTSAGRPAMIFSPEGPRVAADPFAPTRAAWSGLSWQPGPWWAADGVT